MEKLTREELEKQKGEILDNPVQERIWNENCWEMKLITTALSLYTENSELSKGLGQAKAELLLMKEGIKKLNALADEWETMGIEGDSEAEYEQVVATTGCGEELKKLLADITGVGK